MNEKPDVVMSEMAETSLLRVRGIVGHTVFKDRADYYRYLFLLAEAKKKNKVEVIAYCLTEHDISLVLRKVHKPIAIVIDEINADYERAFQKKYNYTKALFCQRKFIEPIETLDELLERICYVHTQSKNVDSINDLLSYEFCSFREYGLEIPKIVEPQDIYIFFPKESFMAVHAHKFFQNNKKTGFNCLTT